MNASVGVGNGPFYPLAGEYMARTPQRRIESACGNCYFARMLNAAAKAFTEIRSRHTAEGWRFMTHTDWSRAHVGLLGAEELLQATPRVRIRSLLLFLAASDKASGMMYNREAEMKYTFVIVGRRLQIGRRTGLS